MFAWGLLCLIQFASIYYACHTGTLCRLLVEFRLGDRTAELVRRKIRRIVVIGVPAGVIAISFCIYFFVTGYMDYMLVPFQTHLLIAASSFINSVDL